VSNKPQGSFLRPWSVLPKRFLSLSLIVVSTDACRRSLGEAWGMVEDCLSADEAAEAFHRAGA